MSPRAESFQESEQLGRHGLRRRPLLLEAFTAEDRTPLRGLEGHRGFALAAGTHRPGLDPLVVAAVLRQSQGLSALGLAVFAALGFVLELFVVEEELFTSGEDEVAATIDTLEDLVLEVH